MADDANNNEVQLYEESPPTPYDLRRLEKIKRNKERLQSLGLGNNTPKQKLSQEPRVKPVRRSPRSPNVTRSNRNNKVSTNWHITTTVTMFH